MFEAIFKWWVSLFYGDPNDPVYHCQFNREMGCCHVDGPDCDMATCPILKDYREFCGDE